MSESAAIASVRELVGDDRIRVVSPDYFEVLGTDRADDANEALGPEFRAYREAWTNNPRDHIVGDFPLHLDVEVTNTCNLRCTMCQIPFSDMPRGFMEMELYERILDEVREHDLPSVKFNFRGEPLMHKEIAEYVRLAKEVGVLEAQFNTNGALLTEELSRDLIGAGLDRIKFSIDGATPEVYDAIRRGTTYEKTIPRVLNFIETRDAMESILPSVGVQMVYMEGNHEEVAKYVRFWEGKANRIGFSRYRAGHNVTGEEQRVERMVGRFPCHQLWQRLVVLYDGTVLMCCGDHHSEMPLGNVRERSLTEIWRSEELEHVRRLHIAERYDEVLPCVDCEVNYR